MNNKGWDETCAKTKNNYLEEVTKKVMNVFREKRHFITI